MSEFEQLLDGVEAALELERELGVRAFTFDRSLLAPLAEPPPAAEPAVTPKAAAEPRAAGPSAPAKQPSEPRSEPPSRPPAAPPGGKAFDVAFLHDRPLSEKGVDMMAKAVNGLGWAAEAAPVVVAAPLPAAKIYIVLGSEAMKKFFPELHGGPGQWLKAPDGADVLVTYSPEYILRFDASLPAVYEKKKEMWMSLKAAKQRIGK